MLNLSKPIKSLSSILLLGSIILIGCQQKAPLNSKPKISGRIEKLAQVTTMTPKAKAIFYRQSPKIIPTEVFYEQCRQPGTNHETSVIFGCYTNKGNQGKIFIQSVPDKNLKGTMEVVAAHEMLHAAFHQLSPSEIATLTPKLKEAVKDYKNTAVLSILKNYEQQNPKTYINELHSYLGTELLEFKDPELEAYYQQYFQDRQQLVKLAQNSQNALYTFETEAKKLQAEITSLESFLQSEQQFFNQAKNNFKATEDNIRQQQDALYLQRTQTTRSIREGNFEALAQFDIAQEQLNSKSQQLEAQMLDYQNRIIEYEAKIDRYNEAVEQYKVLTKDKETVLNLLQNKS